jgi:hypothetical protein
VSDHAGEPPARWRRPVLVVLGADLVLLAVLAVPAVARWVRDRRWAVPGDGTLTVPELSFAALDRPLEVAALGYADWRAGVVVRVAVVLALHALLAAWVARRAAPGRALADTRLAVLAASPLAGGLAGLTVVVPSAFTGVTVEEREVARQLAVDSFLAGASWGLVAGIVAALALTATRPWTAAADPPDADEDDEASDDADADDRADGADETDETDADHGADHGADQDDEDDEDEEVARLLRAAVAAGLAAAGTALALLLLLGGRSLAIGPYGAGPGGPQESRRLLGYVYWALQPTGVSGYRSFDYVPVLVLPPYLLAVLVLGAVAGAVTAARPAALRVAAAWWAVTLALAAYAIFGAVARTAALLQRPPDRFGGSWRRIAVQVVNDAVDDLPTLAAYTALVGWLPALAAAAAAGRAWRRTPTGTDDPVDQPDPADPADQPDPADRPA